jgi:hypothetical protein
MNLPPSSRPWRIAVAAVLAVSVACGTAWGIGGGHGGVGGGRGGGFGGVHVGEGTGAGRLGGLPSGSWRAQGFSSDRPRFAQLDHGRYPYLDHGPAIAPYLYAPYGAYGFYDPGAAYYAACDPYSFYYDPQYCY